MKLSGATLLLTLAAANTALAAVIPAEHRLAVRQGAEKPVDGPAGPDAKSEHADAKPGGTKAKGSSSVADGAPLEPDADDGGDAKGSDNKGEDEAGDAVGGKQAEGKPVEITEEQVKRCIDDAPLEDPVLKEGRLEQFKRGPQGGRPAYAALRPVFSTLAYVKAKVPKSCVPIMKALAEGGLGVQEPKEDEIQQGEYKFKYEPIAYFSVDGTAHPVVDVFKWVHPKFWKGDKPLGDMVKLVGKQDIHNQAKPAGYFHEEGGRVVVDFLLPHPKATISEEKAGKDLSTLTPDDLKFEMKGSTITLNGYGSDDPNDEKAMAVHLPDWDENDDEGDEGEPGDGPGDGEGVPKGGEGEDNKDAEGSQAPGAASKGGNSSAKL